ncbi:thymine dioxygenase [Aureobasidium subglaciale]|nr:thymine dioxygenase [Aureobasidium subglaciale]
MPLSNPIQSNIPIVDFMHWDDRHAQQQIAQSLVDGCRDVGFVNIINHGISEAEIEEAFDWTKRLFDLTHEEKMCAPHPAGPDVHRGYSYPGLEKVSQVYGVDADSEDVGRALREVKDCKESYEIGSEDNSFMPNVWLPEDVLPGFRDFGLSFYWKCNAVAQKILTALAIGLQLDSADTLTQVHSGDYNQLRLLHYPPIRAEELEKQTSARMPAHSDWGSITLLFQDDCGGLQVEDPHEQGRFIDATPIKNGLIMNVGDMLMRWSNVLFEMAPLFALLGLLGFLTSFVSATALTYKLPPNGKECFYSHIEQKGAKVAFYFAVQSGGSFDVDYAVHGPSSEPGREKTILDGTKERQGDFVFTANEAGEYRFCFDNSISTFADKMIDFEISIENEPRAASIPSKQGANVEQTSALENSVLKLSGQLSTITRQQKYFRTRENRNFSTVRSTEQRIFNFSIIESLMMVGMAGLQVFIVRMFFQTGRKGYL